MNKFTFMCGELEVDSLGTYVHYDSSPSIVVSYLASYLINNPISKNPDSISSW